MNKTNDFKYNLPAYSDPVDIEDLNDNFRGIDDALMAGLCKKDYTGNNMGSSDPSARKYAWAPWFEIVNDNEFDVVVTDRNAPVESEEATINIAAGQTFRKYINGRYYMNFYVQDQHDVTFKWFTNAETRINEIEPSGGGGVSSVNVTGASSSHIESSGGPVTDTGTIELSISEGYSIPQTNKQTAWDSKAADLKLEINSSTFVITAQLKDASGNLIGNERTIDLPLEEMVVDAEYDPQTQKIKLELKNGNYVEFSVAELVSGLQTELSASNKLNPEYIAYDASHRAVSDTEKSTWNSKQNAISDLATIRSGATAGATAVQPSEMEDALDEKQDSLSETQLAAVNSGINNTKVAQISANQTNISLVDELNGAKNWLDYSYADTQYNTSINGVTFSKRNDGRIVATGTPTATSRLSLTEANPANGYIDITQYNGMVFHCLTSTGSSTTYSADIIYYDASNTYVSEQHDYGNWLLITVPTNAVKGVIRITVYTGAGSNINLVFEPMIITKAAYDAGFRSFVPYTLPNYDLTRLEAEDRAELIDLVDSGAKQLLQFNNDTSGQLVATVQSDGYTVKVTGGESTGKTVTYATASISKTGLYALKVDLSGTGASCYLYDATTSTQIKEFYASTEEYFTLTAGHTYNIKTYRAGTGTNATIALLLCTKAAFGVSKAFVPYRPSYDDALFVLGERAPKATDGTKSGGSMNDFDSGCVLCTSNVTGGAKAGYCFVRTRIYDSNCVLQQAFYPADNTAYQRCKWSGTWSEWKQFVS